jgi:hypothetical protein
MYTLSLLSSRFSSSQFTSCRVPQLMAMLYNCRRSAPSQYLKPVEGFWGMRPRIRGLGTLFVLYPAVRSVPKSFLSWAGLFYVSYWGLIQTRFLRKFSAGVVATMKIPHVVYYLRELSSRRGIFDMKEVRLLDCELILFARSHVIIM